MYIPLFWTHDTISVRGRNVLINFCHENLNIKGNDFYLTDNLTHLSQLEM